jgi:DNA-binding response OmpR family regulator
MKNISPDRAIVVEDNSLVALGSETVLRILGFDVTIVTDSEAARQLVIAEPPDLLITDIGLPNMGAPLIRWLKAKRPDAKIVGIGEIGEMALAAGADAFLAKPFRLDELERVIHAMTGGSTVR